MKKNNQIDCFFSYTRDTKNFIPKVFLNDLSVQFHNFASKNIQLVSDQFNNFMDVLVRTLNKQAPMKLASKKEKKFKTKPWITKGILNSSKTKTELYKLSLNGTTENLAQYKAYRNKTNTFERTIIAKLFQKRNKYLQK